MQAAKKYKKRVRETELHSVDRMFDRERKKMRVAPSFKLPDVHPEKKKHEEGVKNAIDWYRVHGITQTYTHLKSNE